MSFRPICAAFLVCLISPLATSRAATTIHVAPAGDDAAAGAESAPLRTLQAALRRARAGNEAGAIVLAGGRYELEETLELGPDLSHWEVRAAASAVPILSGGRRLDGWRQDSTRPQLWRTILPDVREGRWYFHQLFVNGQRAQRARIPNAGFLVARGPLGTNAPITLPFQAGDIQPQWAGVPDARLIMLQKWTDLHLPIRAVDPVRNVAVLEGGPRPYWMDETDARYSIENVVEGLDAPGEWHLDRGTGTLSFLAPNGLDPNQALMVAPRLLTLVRVTGDSSAKRPVSGLALRRLTFADTDYEMPASGLISPQAAVPVRGALRVEFAQEGVVEGCRFENVGGYALDLGRGAQRWRIIGNDIRAAGGGGIRLGEPGDREPDDFTACRGHEVTDNHLHQLGRIFAPAVGLIIFQSGGNLVAHNEINDLYYTAISVGWNWGYRETPCRANRIEFNHLHDIGQGRLSDMGGVYTLGIQPGTVIRNNLIHDVVSYGYGGWGLYTDEGSTGIVLEDNVVYRCKSAGFHQHYGRENVIRNNVFALNREHQLMRSRDEDHISFFFTNNVVYFDSGTLLGSTWRNDRFVMDGNVYFDARTGAAPDQLQFSGVPLSEWRRRGHDEHSIVADPIFEDAAHADFRLKSGSPALARGIRSIDLSTVGPRRAAN